MDLTALLALIETIGPPLINLVEKLFPQNSGVNKLAAVANVIQGAAMAHTAATLDSAATDEQVAAATPAREAIESAIQAKVDAMKTAGTLGAEAPAPPTKEQIDAMVSERVAAALAAQKPANPPVTGVIFHGSTSIPDHR